MRLSNIQSYIVSRIKADANLAALGEPIVWSPTTDQNAEKQQIAAALREKGVAFEVGAPGLVNSETDLTGKLSGYADIEVYIAEHVEVTHTPSLLALAETVIATVQHRHLQVQRNAITASMEPYIVDGATVLHRIVFRVQLYVRYVPPPPAGSAFSDGFSEEFHA